MELADITPVFKKQDPTNKKNYMPISILSNLSKVSERCLYSQLSIFVFWLIRYFQNTNADLEKVLMLSIVYLIY